MPMDLHKVQVDAATAWLYGCCAANAAIFGNGERTGNPPLEALVVEHAQLKGMNKKVNYAAITELAEYGRVIHIKTGPERPYNKNNVYHHLSEFEVNVAANQQKYEILPLTK